MIQAGPTCWVKSENIVFEIYKNSGIEFNQSKIRSLGKNIYASKIPPQNIVLSVIESDEARSKKITETTINLIKRRLAYTQIQTDKTLRLSDEQKKEVTINLRKEEDNLKDAVKNSPRFVSYKERDAIGVPLSYL
jgi:tRNA U34 2-thiouridine synthase MnmA/TrmU